MVMKHNLYFKCKMVKSMKNKAKHDKNNVNTAPYNLRNKPEAEKINININHKDVKKTKHERISRKSPGINKETPVKKPSVLSTKVRQRTKKLNNVSTPKARPSRIRKTNEATVKTNESIEKTRESKGKTNEPTEKIKSMFKIKECSVVLTQLHLKTTATKIPKLPIKNTPRIEELSKRLEKLNTVKETATPGNKTLLTASNKSSRPRILRKRNIIPNKYKDYSLNSPLITKNQITKTPNPLAVYEFEFDPLEEPTKNKNESESSDDDNDSMKIVLNKLRRRHKKVVNKKTKPKRAAPKQKIEDQKQKIEDQKQKTLEQEEKQETNEDEIKPKRAAPKQKIEDQKQKTLEQEEKQETNKDEIKPKRAAPKQKIVDQKPKTLEQEEKQETNEGEIKHAYVEKNREIKPQHTNEKQNKTDEENIPVISNSSVEMVSLSDLSDPVSPVDPAIQARNIVNEVTKSFIEDLSDEEINTGSPGRINVVSNVVIKNSRLDKSKNKIFNSTTIGSKPAQPWRINVSAIKKRPQFFTYKDKSFIPSYDKEILTINDSTISTNNYTNICTKNNTKSETKSDKLDKNKQISQTSILDYIKNTKKPKIPEIKNGLFNDLVNKSPRKVLSEINYVQSTPLKPNTNLNILNSPNISIISPKKKKDSMFGFSYFSDDENKENFRKSPRKIKFKTSNPFDDITKQNVPKICTVQKKNNEIPKDITDITICDKEKSVSPIDTEITGGLFQDNQLEVSKKPTRTYVRKHPKRKRIASFATESSDGEVELEKPDRKKQKNVQTKEEEKEVDRLASHYNSMFEEIENYPLIIE